MMEEEPRPAKKFNYKTVILVGLILIMAGVLILLQGKDSFFNLSKNPRLKAGLPAPDFTLPGLDGRPVRLSDYRGKVVLLNIWATWCAPCIEEMPSMQRLYQELKGSAFEILAVSVDQAGAQAVAPFMQKYRLSFPALINPEGTIQNLFGTTGVPESFVVDKKGIVQKVVIGPLDWYTPQMVRFFNTLIEQPTTET